MTWLGPNTVIYQIFIDRFAVPKPPLDPTHPEIDPGDKMARPDDTKPIFCGGTLRGIIEHFDHLKGLGISAIWLSPFYKGEAYHGYHPTDLYAVDPHFGTEEDLKELIALCHKNGIKIIADFVPNHVSDKHPYFLDAQRNFMSKYRDWFYFTNWPNSYLTFLSVKELPKLNLENLDTRAYIIEAAEKWMDMGFDGLRLDHIQGASDGFWKAFFGVMTTKYPDAAYIGEAWLDGTTLKHLKTINTPNKLLAWLRGTPYLMQHYLEFFPSVLDFEFISLARKYAEGKLRRDQFHEQAVLHAGSEYKWSTPTFLDNHDTDRFMFVVGNDVERYKDVARMQFELPLPVIIYQGAEFAMSQDKWKDTYHDNGDLVARRMIPWQKGSGLLYDFYRDLIHKKTNPQT
ncbi:MAG TPA: alpha-amylase family glycosyl hydrolase [Candidatus Paceibacterota bacterium]|nr:alpha-amylase family glycosyl hydrolase [Candidatus Paceibacterota bacterium]